MTRYLPFQAIFKWVCGLLLATIMILGITTPAVSEKNERPFLKRLEGLYRDMGIIKVPLLAPPVDIALPDLTGKSVKLSEFKGKIVFINFWTTWCPTCRIEMPSMEKLHHRFKAEDFILLAVNLQEPAETVKRFMNTHKLTFSVLMDSKGKYGTFYGIRSIPTTFILGKRGGIIGKVIGPREWDSNDSFELFTYLVSSNPE